MSGQRHLVSCRCVLPQFKGRIDPPKHHFLVFSVLKSDNSVVVKYVQCNNCGLVHKVTDICKSEVIVGKEFMSSVITIEDIKPSLPKNLSDILERSNADVTAWEMAQHIVDNKEWGAFVLLGQEEESGMKHGKYVRIMSETFFKVESFSREDIINPGEA